jgi:hypothetical protein
MESLGVVEANSTIFDINITVSGYDTVTDKPEVFIAQVL